jgi:DNA-directed RNA polymerase III subunit RPC1
LIHDRFQAYNRSTASSKVMPPSMVEFYRSFDEARKFSSGMELDKHFNKAVEDLNPLRVLNLFKMITPTDCELLGINPVEGRPEMFIWQYLPAPPVCIRPSVAQENASTEDHLTTKLADIVHISSLIKAALQNGQPLGTIMEQWDFMQLQIAMYVNSDIPGLQQPGFGKAIRGFCQRLKGKQGRFRGNLSGKRVDFSGRTVISPDPNLSIEQVALPELIAKKMTYPERVFQQNIEKMREYIRNGPFKWPGANQIHRKGEENKRSLQFGNRYEIARNLQIGDIVERHVKDGDIVLFNRQPSLHKLSIMAHFAKIRSGRTFRFNECVCGPYNADFDGDEMNIHVPQTIEARTEAIILMGVKNNLCTPKNGELIISATQDFITASYLLSCKDKFLDRKTFAQLCLGMVDSNVHVDIPPPAIVKPEAMWTGKQLFGVLMRPNTQSNVLVNLDAKCRDYRKPLVVQAPDMDINDGWLVVRNSQVMCGRMDKTTVGSGNKDSIFYTILRDFGPDEAVKAMDRLAKLSTRFLTNQGFSIGINDVMGGESLNDQKTALVAKAYTEVDDLIKQYKDGKLEKIKGCSLEETLENAISGLLSRLRQQAGDFCINTLSSWNSPLIMAKSGSKGSQINVAQMITLVGQQMVASARVVDGFQDRTLPHFPKHAKQALSKGFVLNSFFSGLTPTEFFFHAISGREGLVDTAVKTAETGYMSRRLMKSLEDLSTRYDNTVRTAASGIVQFQFGADKLDPVDMEGHAVPVHFNRAFTHAVSTTWDNNERSLLPYEITELCEKLLRPEKDKLRRWDLLRNEQLNYNDDMWYAVDEHESAREFLDTVSNYASNLALKHSKIRKAAGLSELAIDPQLSGEKYNAEARAKTAYIERVAKVSETTLRKFVQLCLSKYKKAQVVPGHAVGAVGAQSIGEPGTQMTLRTFHFAGVAGMSITEGVPRIKEIINASKAISTPVITCPLENPNDIVVARVVKGLIEKTYVSDTIHFIEEMWTPNRATICLAVDLQKLSRIHPDLTIDDISNAICKDRKLKVRRADVRCGEDCIFISVAHHTTAAGHTVATQGNPSLDSVGPELFLRLNQLKHMIPQIPISGYQGATRALIETSAEKGNTVLVEGYGLRACMATEGVIGTRTTSNSIMEVLNVLGIEAARTTITIEIAKVMRGMNIDPRHMQLLADVMTYKGEVLGITRFGLSKMRDSVLQLASFEKTPDHLFEAAAGMKRDGIQGVSESIIMGQTMNVGTGAFGVVRYLGLKKGVHIKKLPTQFEDIWDWAIKERKRAKFRYEPHDELEKDI